MIVIIRLEPGMPSNRLSSASDDYVPALCTHRPSLLPIGLSGENGGFWYWMSNHSVLGESIQIL
jgi:hypothetical protein